MNAGFRIDEQVFLVIAERRVRIEGWKANAWLTYVGDIPLVGGVLVNGEIPGTEGSARSVLVVDGDRQAFAEAYETNELKCFNCRGTGKRWQGWSVQEGARHRPCERCGGSGLVSWEAANRELLPPGTIQVGPDGRREIGSLALAQVVGKPHDKVLDVLRTLRQDSDFIAKNTAERAEQIFANGNVLGFLGGVDGVLEQNATACALIDALCDRPPGRRGFIPIRDADLHRRWPDAQVRASFTTSRVGDLLVLFGMLEQTLQPVGSAHRAVVIGEAYGMAVAGKAIAEDLCEHCEPLSFDGDEHGLRREKLDVEMHVAMNHPDLVPAHALNAAMEMVACAENLSLWQRSVIVDLMGAVARSFPRAGTVLDLPPRGPDELGPGPLTAVQIQLFRNAIDGMHTIYLGREEAPDGAYELEREDMQVGANEAIATLLELADTFGHPDVGAPKPTFGKSALRLLLGGKPN